MAEGQEGRVHGRTADAGLLGLFGVTAYVGAAVYFIQQAHGFWNVVLALLKAFVWPAYLVLHVLMTLKV